MEKPIEQKKKLFNPEPVTLDSGLPGVKLDFNFGARVLLPDDGEYRVRFTDMDTGSILYDGIVRNNLITSNKKYYINFRVEIWKNGAQPFIHDLNLSGRNVLIVFPVGTLGDSLAWFPYAEEFRKKHRCNDQRNEQKLGDFGSCPHHRGTDKEFECSRHITVEFMRDMIDRLIRDVNDQ